MKLSTDRQKRLNEAFSRLEMEITMGMISDEIKETLAWRSIFMHPVTGVQWELRVSIDPGRW